MKKRIDAVLEDTLITEAERKAILKKLTFDQLLEEALLNYLKVEKREIKKESITEKSQGSMRIPQDKLKAVMEEDSYYDA